MGKYTGLTDDEILYLAQQHDEQMRRIQREQHVLNESMRIQQEEMMRQQQIQQQYLLHLGNSTGSLGLLRPR